MTAPPPDVSILVVTYDSAAVVDACLAAALAQEDGDLGVEVVVVDNASSDDTPARVARHERVRLVRLARNAGYAEGVNAAVAHAAAPLVLLLNPDCAMDRGCAGALRDHLEASPRTGMAAALLREPDGSLQRFARREPTLAIAWWSLTETGRRIDRRFRGGRGAAHRRYERDFAAAPTEPFPVDCPAAACVLVRRELLGDAPMRRELPLYYNDMDLCRRLREAGWRCDVVPAAGARHEGGASLHSIDPARARAEMHAALIAYARLWWPRRRRLALVALLLLDALAGAVALAAGRGTHDTRHNVRGVLGALGLPGGARPWLSAAAGRRGPGGR
jgi:N-acetylglucosaminyl-diphospho-decaprenol L-rhamnosyltransferase